jgi:hypothetical protein
VGTATLTSGSLWIPPADCPVGTKVTVNAWGAGSGASGRSAGASFGAAGAGGAFANTPAYFVTPNDVANGVGYVIGAGSAGTAGSNPSAGGNTSFAANNLLNLLINSTNQNAVVGSPGTNPTNGGPTNLGGLSASVVAFGTNPTSGYQYIQYRLYGTSSGGILPIIAYTTNAITSATYTGSFRVAYVAGSLANISGVTMAFDSFTSGFASYLSTTINLPITLTGTMTPYSGQAATPATTAVGNLYLAIPCAAGAIDITIQIEALQFELGSSVTAWKSTGGYTLAQGGGAPSATTGGVGSATLCVAGLSGYSEAGGSGAAYIAAGAGAGLSGYSEAGGSGAAYNAAGAGGGGAGGPSGVGAAGTTAGVGGQADNGGGGLGGAVKTTSPGNPGAANANGGGGGGALTTVGAGTAGAGGLPGGGGGAAVVAGATGGAGAGGQITLSWTSVWPASAAPQGSSSFSGAATLTVGLRDALSGVGTFAGNASIRITVLSAVFVGSGAFAGNALVVSIGAAQLSGYGLFAANGTVTLAGELSGFGSSSDTGIGQLGFASVEASPGRVGVIQGGRTTAVGGPRTALAGGARIMEVVE